MSEDLEVEESGPGRRSVMKAAALVALPAAGAGTVAACSSGSSSGSSSGAVTVASSKVPVGGGYIDTSKLVVVTQPQAGTFKAFTAVCTHQGCTVATVEDNKIQCPCHGSVFSAQDGSVLAGPAPSPLSSMTATVSGTNIDVTPSH